MALSIRPARIGEAADLSALCLRSKGFWGYDRAFLDACRPVLTITPGMMDPETFAVRESDGRVVGVVQVSYDNGEFHLEKLFVDPVAIGEGHGVALFRWAEAKARLVGARAMLIESDPDAAPFYRKMGAEIAGAAASEAIPGRMLPLLRYAL